MEAQTPWMGEYVWEENKCDGSAPECVPLPEEVVAMFRPSKCLLCGTVTNSQQSAFTHYEGKGHFKKVAQYMRENYNVLGTLKSKEKFRPVRCDVCQIDLTSRIVLMQHYEGKPHLKNLQKKADQPGAPVVAEKKDSADAPTDETGDFENPLDFVKDLPPPPPLPKLGIYFCSLCQIKTKLKGQMEIHNTGSRHLKNLSKLADGELKEFFLANGNCEPVEGDGQDSTPPSTPVRDNQMASPFTQVPTPPVGGYQYPQGMDPSMRMPMMPPPYPQMPYGQYPPYPMGYDYNTWNQGQQGYAGQPPYGDYNAAQPPYGYNSGPYLYPNQPQYLPNQHSYPSNQQQYPNQQYPPNNQYPPNQQFPPSQPFQSGPVESNEPCPAAPGTTDFPMTPYGKKSTRRSKEGRSSPKDPEVRETEVPENFELKPLAVSNFIKLLAQEAKLESKANDSSTKSHSDQEISETKKVEQTGVSSTVGEVEGQPGNEVLPPKTNDIPDSKGVDVTNSPSSRADDDSVVDGMDSTTVNATIASEFIENNHEQDGIDENSCRDEVSKATKDGGCDDQKEISSDVIKRSQEDPEKLPESPSSDNHEQERNPGGKFIAFGFTEAKVAVKESGDSSGGRASTDAFKFTIGGKATVVGKAKVNTFFKRSTEKMLKEAKEKKRVGELKKFDESDGGIEYKEIDRSAVKVEGSGDSIANTAGDQTKATINARSPKNVETEKLIEGFISKDLEKIKDKSEGEISDDVGEPAAVSSGNTNDSLSVLKASYLTRNSVSDNEGRVDIKDEVEKKNPGEGKEVQNVTPIKFGLSPEKQKPSLKKFSASDKKKVSRTRNSSSDGSRKSRSRSRSRRKRSGRRRSSSWSPSSEDESKHEYQGRTENYGQDNYQNYYGYNNRNRKWRNNQGGRGYYNRGFHHRNYWNQERFSGWDNQDDYYEEKKRQVEETDEFGREKRRREDKKKEKRESKKRRKEKKSPSAVSVSSRSSSGSRSRSRKKSSKRKKSKSKKHALPSPVVEFKKTMKTPETPKELVESNMSQIANSKPLTLAQKLRLETAERISDLVPEEKKVLTFDEIEVPEEFVGRAGIHGSLEKIEEIAHREVETQKTIFEKPLPSKLLEVLVKEREKQEILKKMALIKMKLQQKEKEKAVKKKKKKEKSKKKKKKRSSSTSSSSSSSSSSSDSSSSSTSSSSSSQSESLAEKLLAKMKRDSKGAGPSSLLPDLAKVLPLLKKDVPEETPKKKKKKKDKKAKKKKSKKSSKAESSQSSLSAYLTPNGLYFCKYCNQTFASGDTFIEHCHSEKHKLMFKLVKEKPGVG